jgi:hypothetical protein
MSVVLGVANVIFSYRMFWWKKEHKLDLQAASAKVLDRLRAKWHRNAYTTTDAIRGCDVLKRTADRERLIPLLFGDSAFVLIEGPSAAGKSFLLAQLLV